MGAIRLENDRMETVFDDETGALLALTHKPTGWRIQGRVALAQSFSLVVPLPDRLLNVIDGRRQRPAAVRKDSNGSRLILTWDGLESEHGSRFDIRLEASATLDDSGLSFEMTIDNRSPFPVESAAYPVIGDLRRPIGSDGLSRANLSYCNLNVRSLYPAFPNERGYWGTEYPIQMIPTPESPFVLILGDQEGLYAGCHDTSAQERVEFTFALKPGYGKVGYAPPGDEIDGHPARLEFMATHLPFVQPGETYELSPIRLQPFAGDWHAGADIYKAWRATWMARPPVPRWLQEPHAWQQIQMTSWGDTLRIPYRDLVMYGEDCVRHGVQAIQLTGWTLYGQDGRLPIHEIDPRLGAWDELQEAIRAIQRMGVKVVLYEKYTCADIATDWFERELFRYASKDSFGHPHGHEGWRYDTPAHLAGINTRPYAWMCMNAAQWHEIALEQIRASLKLNPAGILLDECQWHGTNAFYCFDETHGHRAPAYNFGGDALFERKLRQLLDDTDPELVLAGEGCYDLQNRHYTLSYHRTGPGHAPGMRYVDPFLPMMNWVYGYDDRENANLCLLYRYIISYEPRHFRGRLGEFPSTLEYGKKIDALRRRYRDFLWDAEFRDTVGVRVTANGHPHALYSVFEAESGARAVVVANHGDDEVLAVVETGDRAGKFRLVSPEEPDSRSSDGTIRLPPRAVAALLESV